MEYYGRTRSFSQFGSSINALIAAGLVFYSGDYRTMFLAATIPYVLDFFNLASYPRELDGELTQFSRETIGAQVRDTLKVFWRHVHRLACAASHLNSSGFQRAFQSQPKIICNPFWKASPWRCRFSCCLEDKRRSALVIGLVYFVIYLFTSYASRSAAGFSHRFSSLGRAINLTFLAGAAFLFVAGLATWGNVTWLAILVFLLFYVLHNLRRPMNVSFISDQISNRVMASGLSVESQFTTLLTAIFAPILGALADYLGVGAALTILAAGVLPVVSIVRVDEKPVTVASSLERLASAESQTSGFNKKLNRRPMHI